MVNVASTIKALFNSEAFLAAVNAACAAASLPEVPAINAGVNEYVWESGAMMYASSQGPALACDVRVPSPHPLSSDYVYDCHVGVTLSLMCAETDAQTERRQVAAYADALYEVVQAMNWTATTQGAVRVILSSPAGEDPSGIIFVPEGPLYARIAQYHHTLWVSWQES